MAEELEETEAEETREKLLSTLKKEVKQIMEEAVTRKFIHQESSSITSLCAAVDACIHFGLKKRSLGLFKQSSSSALLQKISKSCEDANKVVKIVNEVESEFDFTAEITRKILDSNKNQKVNNRVPSYHPKYYWIRVALFEKVLSKICDYLVENSSKYYCKGALISDPGDGPLFSSLLVGPCSLDFTKMKTPDHLWTDPPADELVQRHRIHSGNSHYFTKPESPKRPGLQVQRNTSSSSEESVRGTPVSGKEYVESLHQNGKTVLLYGKNNVYLQPKEDVASLAGYLSLHQSADSLTIKWTPNQLMNGCCKESEDSFDRRLVNRPKPVSYKRYLQSKITDLYWDYALTVYLEDIVYLHCHQQPDSGGTVVLVGLDGVQHPPIHFPKGGHLLAFLSCLENGLLPQGQLDPPLWSQRGKGKVFPKLRRKGSRQSDIGSGAFKDEPTDYVFRIITNYKPVNIPQEVMEPKVEKKDGLNGFHFNGFTFPWNRHKEQEETPSTMETYAQSQQNFNNICISKSVHHRSSIRQLCNTMKKQIISRAFYGWLSHCRHLKTVRTHLSGLVLHNALNEPQNADKGLTETIWQDMNKAGCIEDFRIDELYKLVYYGGVEHCIRKEVWPYLLGHYKFGSSREERQSGDASVRMMYEHTMSDWLAVEAIVKQKEKENLLLNLARMNTETSIDTDAYTGGPFMRQQSNLSNDVFLEGHAGVEVDADHRCGTVFEESSSTELSPARAPSHVNSESRTLAESKPEELVEKQSELKVSEDTKSRQDSGSYSRKCSETEVLQNGFIPQPASKRVLRRSDELDSSMSLDEGLGDSLAHRMHSDTSTRYGLTSCECDSIEDETLIAEPTNNTDYVESNIEKPKRLAVNGKTDSSESLTGASPASHGGVYSAEFLDVVGLNLHRIDKDVHRCDRNHPYFTTTNLDKLRNIMCTYVWEHLDSGYVQGMCDLVAPLLVILDDEEIAYSCFCELMKRMTSNFPHGGAMDTHFANMRSLIQILDSELFEHMHLHGDFTHFYFCYRWFLLDFKRELKYSDIFSVWEVIWASNHISSYHFVLFFALALVEFYREIILDNNMDFTDIIKFFNEMAERHDAQRVLKIARDLVFKLQNLIDNK